VVGRYPARGELVLDCGSTALHKDPAGLPDGTWGELADHPSAVITKLTQELAVVASREGLPPLDVAAFPLGTALRVLPNHACMAAAQHEVFYVVPGPLRADSVEAEPVFAGSESASGDDSDVRSEGSALVVGEWRPAKFW
jgi:D-serine deaminase-like pyridoxal phosphate-dependent protein